LGPGGRVITSGDVDIVEITPAPDAAEIIDTKWLPADAATVSSIREIAEVELPSDTMFKDAWVDDGADIIVDMDKARAIHSGHILQARTDDLARLSLREAALRLQGDAIGANQAVADKAKVDELDLIALATQMAKASDPTTLNAIWPSVLSR